MNVVEARLAAVEARLAALETRLGSATNGHTQSNGTSASGGAIATDADLDGQWGDPVVKKDPKQWLDNGGASYAGSRMSQCPSAYLRALASLFDWMAAKDEAKGATYTNKHGKEVPTAPFKRTDAARARGWAKRNEGLQAPSQDASSGSSDQDQADMEIPF